MEDFDKAGLARCYILVYNNKCRTLIWEGFVMSEPTAVFSIYDRDDLLQVLLKNYLGE